MQTYVGYGFDANDLTEKDWLEIVKKSKNDYADFCADCKDNFGNNDEETLLANVIDWIESAYSYCSAYLCAVINECEYQSAGADNIVCAYDDFVVFDSIRFIDDSPRTRYITSQDAFIALISKYVKTDNITFGNLYDGIEWVDANYYLE